ncbi:hypothetical protein P7C73_g5654, partial [Tremellales sp. Uapishka_1]
MSKIREAALAAAEARLRGEPNPGVPPPPPAPKPWEPTEKGDRDTRLQFGRLLDRGIIRDNGYRVSAEAVEVSTVLIPGKVGSHPSLLHLSIVNRSHRYISRFSYQSLVVLDLSHRSLCLVHHQTLIKISSNILSNPHEPKYRELKSTNNLVKTKILAAKGGQEYLIALGFRTKVVDHTQVFALQDIPRRMHELQLGNEILMDHIKLLQDRVASTTTASIAHSAAEKARIEAALRAIDEDRDKVKARVAREKVAREAREKADIERKEREKLQDKEEADVSDTIDKLEHGEHPEMRVDPELDDSDEESGGEEDAFIGGGRPLGTRNDL